MCSAMFCDIKVKPMKLNKDNVMFSSMLCDIKVKNKKLNKDDCYVFFHVM